MIRSFIRKLTVVFFSFVIGPNRTAIEINVFLCRHRQFAFSGTNFLPPWVLQFDWIELYSWTFKHPFNISICVYHNVIIYRVQRKSSIRQHRVVVIKSEVCKFQFVLVCISSNLIESFLKRWFVYTTRKQKWFRKATNGYYKLWCFVLRTSDPINANLGKLDTVRKTFNAAVPANYNVGPAKNFWQSNRFHYVSLLTAWRTAVNLNTA